MLRLNHFLLHARNTLALPVRIRHFSHRRAMKPDTK